MAILVTLVLVHQIFEVSRVVLLEPKLPDPLYHSLGEGQELLALGHYLDGPHVSDIFLDQGLRFFFWRLLTVRIVERFRSMNHCSLFPVKII